MERVNLCEAAVCERCIKIFVAFTDCTGLHVPTHGTYMMCELNFIQVLKFELFLN